MKNERIHSSMLVLVGVYMFYIVYQLFEKYRSGTGEMPDSVFIIAMIVFTLAGIGTMYYSWNVYKKWRKAEDEKRKEENNIEIEKVNSE